MTAFDDRFRALADRLIDRYGKAVTLRRTTRVHDPVTGETSDSAEEFEVKISPPEVFSQELIDGTLIKVGDLRTDLAAKSAPVVPAPITDRLIVDQFSYDLLHVDVVMSGELAAFYRLQLRR